ncbi:hemerythrin domain-containing protein [Streptomyces sp. NPDC055140]
MGPGGTVIAELTVGQREVDELFIRIEAQPARDTRRRELADELTVELVRHSVAEEQYLYLAVREHVDGGDALADKELEDHAEAVRLLKDLEGRDGDGDQFDTTVAKLESEVTDRYGRAQPDRHGRAGRRCPRPVGPAGRTTPRGAVHRMTNAGCRSRDKAATWEEGVIMTGKVGRNKVKGKAKEMVGKLFGDRRMQADGKADQAKAETNKAMREIHDRGRGA